MSYERSSDVCTAVERILSGCSHGNLRERGCAVPPHSPPRSVTNRAVPSRSYHTATAFPPTLTFLDFKD